MRGADMAGLSLPKAQPRPQRGWQPLTALLGFLKPDPTVEQWHGTLPSGKGAWVPSASWVTLVKPLVLTVPQFPNLSSEIGLR